MQNARNLLGFEIIKSVYHLKNRKLLQLDGGQVLKGTPEPLTDTVDNLRSPLVDLTNEISAAKNIDQSFHGLRVLSPRLRPVESCCRFGVAKNVQDIRTSSYHSLKHSSANLRDDVCNGVIMVAVVVGYEMQGWKAFNQSRNIDFGQSEMNKEKQFFKMAIANALVVRFISVTGLHGDKFAHFYVGVAFVWRHVSGMRLRHAGRCGD